MKVGDVHRARRLRDPIRIAYYAWYRLVRFAFRMRFQPRMVTCTSTRQSACIRYGSVPIQAAGHLTASVQIIAWTWKDTTVGTPSSGGLVTRLEEESLDPAFTTRNFAPLSL